MQLNHYLTHTQHHLRYRVNVPHFYQVIETQVEAWRNEKCCGNTTIAECFFKFSQTFTSVSIKQLD